MGKRLRRDRSICSCISPKSSYHSSLPVFSWYQDDLWIEIAKFMDAKTIVTLAATCRWFHRIMTEDCVWRYACLRDLQVPAPRKAAFKWTQIYTSAFDGSHSFMFHQKEKHIDWMRIGAFFFDSSEALLMEKLMFPMKLRRDNKIGKMLETLGYCVLDKIKTGIWIADLQLVRCPVCDQNTCDGTMQIVDIRHIELFLNGEYHNGSWDFELIGSHDIKKNAETASGGILDLKHLKDPTTAELFNLKSWVGKPKDWQPKAMITLHAVAVNTNLQDNEGLHVKYHVMRAGAGGEVVSIRLSQQLI